MPHFTRRKFRPKFTHEQCLRGVEAKLQNMLAHVVDYPQDRTDGELYLQLNGKETYVYLEPNGNCTQWRSTVNGVLFKERSGMTKVYSEVARLNPPLMSIYNLQ